MAQTLLASICCVFVVQSRSPTRNAYSPHPSLAERESDLHTVQQVHNISTWPNVVQFVVRLVA